MIAVEANPFVSLNGVTGTGAGSEWPAAGYRTPAVQVEGIVAGDTIDIEASIDGVAWEVLGSTITADGVYVVAAGAGLLRANVTAVAGGGTLNAWFMGH
jgi:hypothetical protein